MIVKQLEKLLFLINNKQNVDILRKTHPPQYIAGLATKNRNVIETTLEKIYKLYQNTRDLSCERFINYSRLCVLFLKQKPSITKLMAFGINYRYTY